MLDALDRALSRFERAMDTPRNVALFYVTLTLLALAGCAFGIYREGVIWGWWE